MNDNEKDLQKAAEGKKADSNSSGGDSKLDALNELQDDIIRNDTIPETKNTPGSNGAYPVGAFDTSKD